MPSRVATWLFAPGDPRRLAALRIGLCSILAVQLTRGVYVELADQPAALFRPRSFMNLLDAMPPKPVVLALQAIGVAAALAAALGWRARIALPVAFACGLFLSGMTTSLGKVVHNDVLLLLCLAPLLGARVTDAWALDAHRTPPPGEHERYGYPVRTAIVVVAGAYFFAGFAKLIASGPAWVTSENLRWVMYVASDNRATPNDLALFVADRAWLSHAMAAFTLLFELAAIALLWVRGIRPWYAVGAAGLHAGIWATMGLNYWAQAATVVVVLVDWPAIVSGLRARRRARLRVT